jgi:predicted ABC-type ATPase
MIVVAGPSGSGKSVRFSVHTFGVKAFNVDDRCRELHGSYLNIPQQVRKRAHEECERFVEDHIQKKTSFATETTLRTIIAIEQAKRAKKAGFFTSFVYIATDDVETNIERIRLRGLAGGHSAPPDTIRENYRNSLGNLAYALEVFDRGEVYDNSGARPCLVLEVRNGRIQASHPPIPNWVREALAGSSLAGNLDSPTH